MTTTEWWLLAAAGFAFGRWMDCLLRLRRRDNLTCRDTVSIGRMSEVSLM